MKTKQVTLTETNLILLRLILAREKQRLLNEYLVSRDRKTLFEVAILKDVNYQLSDDIILENIFVTPHTIKKYGRQGEPFDDLKAMRGIIGEVFGSE